MFATHALRDGLGFADNLYQIRSEVESCTVWLYNTVYLYYMGFLDNFFLLSVSARLNKTKQKN